MLAVSLAAAGIVPLAAAISGYLFAPLRPVERAVLFACAALLLVAVVVLIAVASVARAIGAPLIWSIEVAQLLFLWLCIFAIDLALQDGRHFGIGLLLDNLPPSGRKAVVEATLEANGEVTSTCRGVFVAVEEGHPAYHRW